MHIPPCPLAAVPSSSLPVHASPPEASRALMRRRIAASGKDGADAGTVASMNDKGQTDGADASLPSSSTSAALRGSPGDRTWP